MTIRSIASAARAAGLAIALPLALAFAPFETALADEKPFSGPTKGVGISSKTIGLIDLGPEIEGLDGRNMRMRYWEVAPGGIVPVHSHKNRPAMIYFLEGEIVQHRSDKDEPEVFRPGDVSVEAEGVVHWWENTGDVTVRMIAIDIFQTAQ